MMQETSPVPIALSMRLLYAIVTVILPIVSFALAFNDFGPEWQSGKLGDYTQIMLGGEVSQIFYPFLAYSIISMVLLLISPLRFSKYFIVRLGIYTGVVLSLQYAILLIISFPETGLFIIGGISFPFVASWIYSRLKTRFDLRITWVIIIGGLFCFLLIWYIVAQDIVEVESGLLLFGVVTILSASPFWCLIIASLVSMQLIRDYEFSRTATHNFGVFAWLIAFVGAWRIAVLKTLEVYASLPTEPPDCYIATAAAKGHPEFVKSKSVSISSGNTIRVNAQVKHFKGAELALMALFPGGHKISRRIYDQFGSLLAYIVIHPILADIVYIILKPIEWGIMAILRVLISDVDEVVKKFYTELR
jgi:hypothetical protein